MPWLEPTSSVVLDMAEWLNQGQKASVIHCQWENLPVPGHATKNAPTSCLLMPAYAYICGQGRSGVLFWCDWYEALVRPAPAPLPRQEEFGVLQQPVMDWGPARPYREVRLT